MKTTNRNIVFTLIIAVIFLMTACGGEDAPKTDDGNQTTAKQVQTENDQAQGETTAASETTVAEEAPSNLAMEIAAKTREDKDNSAVLSVDGLTIEPTVLFEKDNVKVNAVELIRDEYGELGLNVHITNNSDKDITVDCPQLSVNGYMITNLFSAGVRAGQESDESIIFLNDIMLNYGMPITTVGEIELSFAVRDQSNYNELFVTEPITIKTSKFDATAKPNFDDGSVIFERDGFKIIALNLYEYEDGNCECIVMHIENNSDQDADVYCSDLVVNDYTLSPYFTSKLPKGKMVIATIDVFEVEQKAETISIEFEFNEMNSFNAFLKTKALALKVK
ncbi:MAG: hypothetical protein CSA13_00970 [Clostridiales bacterium]|nr:MAG: hypothetical protein CSB19_00300 [Clostridiales bacterium]PIE77141.1 MAG: hypothetical protein CSA13_00970 [Clostridiales bacterium]